MRRFAPTELGLRPRVRSERVPGWIGIRKDFRRDLARRRATGTRRALGVLTLLGLVATGLTVLAALPQLATVEAIKRDDPDLRRAKLVLTGYVVDSRVGTMSFADESGAELTPFSLRDDTGRMIVWYEPAALSPPLRDGDHVRATGQQFLVDTDRSKKVRFIASAVKRVP